MPAADTTGQCWTSLFLQNPEISALSSADAIEAVSVMQRLSCARPPPD